MREDVAELTPLVDRPRRRDAHVAGNAAGRRELAEQVLHALRVLRDAGVDLRVGPFEIDVGHEGGTAVARPGQVDHARVVLGDEPVQVHVDEGEAGRGAPVAEQPRLDVLGA